MVTKVTKKQNKETVFIYGTVPKWVDSKRRQIAKERYFGMRMSLSMALTDIMIAGIKALGLEGDIDKS